MIFPCFILKNSPFFFRKSTFKVTYLYKGGLDQTESKSAKDLIEIEWKLIDKLLHMAETTRYDKQKAFYYQTLAGHICTLSALLKLHGQPDQTQDLAKLLSQIQTQAKTLAKRLKQCKKL